MEVDYDRGTLRHSSFQEGAAPRAGQDCASLEGIRTDPRVADQLLRIGGIGREQQSGARKTLRVVFESGYLWILCRAFSD